jgi:hypothetical protein
MASADVPRALRVDCGGDDGAPTVDLVPLTAAELAQRDADQAAPAPEPLPALEDVVAAAAAAAVGAVLPIAAPTSTAEQRQAAHEAAKQAARDAAAAASDPTTTEGGTP